MPQNERDRVLVPDPKTLAERKKVAEGFAEQFNLKLPILVDPMSDPFEKAFAAWPDRVYVLDGTGKVAYKGDPGPRGFKVAEAPAVLDRLLTKKN